MERSDRCVEEEKKKKKPLGIDSVGVFVSFIIVVLYYYSQREWEEGRGGGR